MGWDPFGSEEVTRVATQVSRVVNNESVPNSIKAGVIKAFFNDGDLPNYIMEELVASIGVKAERMYRYAEQYYTYGLPSGEIYSSTQGRQEVEAVIETLVEGRQVSMQYSHFGAPNALHLGWTKLVANHGYNYETNQLGTLTAAKGTPVYLKDMVVVVPASRINSISSAAIAQWGTAPCAGYTPERPMNVGDVRNFVQHSPINTSATATEVSLYVTYVWKVGAVLHEAAFTISTADFALLDGYFHASYLVDGQLKFWMYKNDSGTYPTLDAVFVESPAVSGSYFPFAYFRYNKASTTSNTATDAYKTSKRMLKYLGIDYAAVAEAINENPSIADVEQAMLVMAMPPVSTNAIDNKYLFDYFDNLHAALGGNNGPIGAGILSTIAEGGGDGWFGSVISAFLATMNRHTTVIQDARFKMTLSHNGIYKRVKAGVIGPVNTYTSVFNSTEISAVTVDQETGQSSTRVVPVKVHRYQHQLSPNLYEEVMVSDLQMTYFIYGGYTTTGYGTDDILLVPIDKSVTTNYSIAEKEILYSRSLHFVFNSRTVTEVEWYEQEWFQVFIIVVAIYITVQTGGSDGGKTLAAALGLEGTAALVAVVIFDLVVMNAIYTAGFRLFVKTFGQEFATLVTIAALVYMGYQVGTKGVSGAPWAKEMLMLSNGLQQAVIQSKFGDLMEEQRLFEDYANQENKELEQANKLLENQTVLSPFTIFGEKPEDYFNRTVHYGNIGTLGITAISSYVDMALTLPKIQDTLGEPLYG